MAQAIQNSSIQNAQQKSQEFYNQLKQWISYYLTVAIEFYNTATAFGQELIKRTQSKMEASPPFRHFVYVFSTLAAIPIAIFLITGGGIVLSAILAFVLGFVSVTGVLLGVSAIGLLAVLAVVLTSSLGLVGFFYSLLFLKDYSLYAYNCILDIFSSSSQLPLKPQNGPKYD